MFFGCLPCCGGEQICPRASDWPRIRSDIGAGVTVSAQAFFSYTSTAYNLQTQAIAYSFEQHATFSFNQTLYLNGLYQLATIYHNGVPFTVRVESSQNSYLGNYVKLSGFLDSTSNGFGFSIALGPCNQRRYSPYFGGVSLRFYHNTLYGGISKHSPGTSWRFPPNPQSSSLPENPIVSPLSNSPLYVGNPIPAVNYLSAYNEEATRMLPAWGGFYMGLNQYTPAIQPNLLYKDYKAACILFESATVEADGSDLFFGHYLYGGNNLYPPGITFESNFI